MKKDAWAKWKQSLECFVVLVCELRENCQFPIFAPGGIYGFPLREKGILLAIAEASTRTKQMDIQVENFMI
jgi:hypothetical protein